MLFVRFVLYFFQEDKNNVCICIAKGDFLIPIFKIYQCDCEKLGVFFMFSKFGQKYLFDRWRNSHVLLCKVKSHHDLIHAVSAACDAGL